MKETNKSLLFLLIITGAAALLRLAALTTHSMWWDELLRMNIANPAHSFNDILNLCREARDPAPRAIYLVLNVWMTLFGYNDASARLLVALTGMASIPVVYLIGKALAHARVGLIAASVTAVNYYHIYYSLDIGYYPFLFLLAALSYLFFIRLTTSNTILNLILYGLTTFTLMVMHHFAILVFAAQVITYIAIFRQQIWLQIRFHFRYLLVSAFIGFAYYPFLKDVFTTLDMNLKLPSPGSYFFINFFYGYFGYSGVTTFCALFAFAIFMAGALLVTSPYTSKDPAKNNAVLILLIWILFPLLAAYTKTVQGTTALIDRYTIVILPGLLLCISLGFDYIIKSSLKYAAITLFICCSLIVLIYERGFYTSTNKDDFKGVVRFVQSNQKQTKYHVLSDKSWFFKYYFDQYGLTPQYLDHEILSDHRFLVTDKVYRNEWLVIDTNLKDIWIVSAHFQNLDQMKHICDTMLQSQRFTLQESFDGHDAMARHLIRKY